MIAANPALAAGADFRPVLVPIDQGGAAYFDLELEPGETQELQVEIGNEGSALTPVRAYACYRQSNRRGSSGRGAPHH
jgi:hypothetical protein